MIQQAVRNPNKPRTKFWGELGNIVSEYEKQISELKQQCETDLENHLNCLSDLALLGFLRECINLKEMRQNRYLQDIPQPRTHKELDASVWIKPVIEGIILSRGLSYSESKNALMKNNQVYLQ
ncbi:hypothetical protein [Cylindrospermum sp. FACHB-282]|uniref:hypothetical protein n=1 Tax=Cylindrospermum sp. FACHB-282 TaxID=2692794 RepID=UPI001682B29F|nr:hypothetical protein [Cylindrospermum sp. FACHB-282]MBD2386020.1 hypothetical protein [Cylindrospermum sp. FACHB-282]